MPDIDITIGGRTFQVSCQKGEEHFLRSAAQMLDIEAQPLVTQLGRLPESRMLLMAGLMLADKTAALEDELRSLRAKLSEAQDGNAPSTEIPASVTAAFTKLATQAEALAVKVEERA